MAAHEIDTVAARRRPGSRWILTTHLNPDGDGIGSQAGFAAWLRRGGAEVRIVNRDAIPGTLRFLDPEGCIEVYDPAEHDAPIAEADAVVMLDNSDPARLGEMEGAVRAARGLKICIDHHPEPDPMWDLLLVDPEASCTAEIVLRLFEATGDPVDRDAATALYAALVSDTGRFRFGNTDADAFRMAAKLVAAGASPAEVYARLEERFSAAFLVLLGRMLADLEVRAGGRLLVLRTPADFEGALGPAGEDLSEVINLALRSSESRVAVLFRPLGPDRTKISLRSKGRLDVNRLARAHGGGGHRNASGIVMEAGLEEAAARLLPELERLVTG
ncbi:MAG: bifunctional oligoribonuclease/PAP phosphatase NrnA [Acidobacteria bacterium]|nr:MAG: bifunctional oligoribonuclease/PAP phosphatase NrnA [Acidobacteriota bacterium]